MPTIDSLLVKLEELSDPGYRTGLSRFGIPNENALGIRAPVLRKLAREIGKNQILAEQLWCESIHEAKTLASLIADPKQISPETCQKWVQDICSWDICDGVCHVFATTPYGVEIAKKWCSDETEFVKRAGFVTLTMHTVHNKKAPDDEFISFFHLIRDQAWDGRNFVKKGINWLLRQIGKRNVELNKAAIAVAQELEKHEDISAKWIAKDALRELTSKKIQERLKRKNRQ